VNHFEIFKELYYKELEQKEALRTNAISLPLTILTGISAIQFYFLTNFSYIISPFLSVVFFVFVMASAIAIGISIYFLTSSYNNFFRGRKYRFVSQADLLHKYYVELQKYHSQHDKKSQEEIDKVFEDYLLKCFVECTAHNQLQNDTRSNLINKVNQYLIIAITTTALTTAVFLSNFFLKKNSPVEVKVLNLNTTTLQVDSILNLKVKDYAAREREQQ